MITQERGIILITTGLLGLSAAAGVASPIAGIVVFSVAAIAGGISTLVAVARKS